MRGWIKIDDGMPEHPKIDALGPVAAWTFICSIAYANRALTDGFVPANIAHRLSDYPEHGEPQSVVVGLVTAGLWIEVHGGYLIHDYLDHQRSKADILDLHEVRKAAGSKGGKMSSRAKDKQVLKQNASKRPSKTQAEQEQEQEQEPKAVTRPPARDNGNTPHDPTERPGDKQEIQNVRDAIDEALRGTHP